MSHRTSPGRELYDKFAKPLESEHPGEFVAISRDGKLMFGRDLYRLIKQASRDFGPDNHVFKVGDRVLGKWR